MVSQAKLAYALEHVDLGFRGTKIGGPMASAYANFHVPFDLYRCVNDFEFHHVLHLDRWSAEPALPGPSAARPSPARRSFGDAASVARTSTAGVAANDTAPH